MKTKRFQIAVTTQLLASAVDGVPNIRILAAQTLGEFKCRLPAHRDCTVDILPVLAELENDKDKDVKACAAQAKLMYA